MGQMTNANTDHAKTDHSWKSFKWLNATQFFGALNDNLFKQLIIFSLIAFTGAQQSSEVVAKALIVFVVPFLLFTAYAGVLADRLSKSKIIRATKLAEVAIMILGAMAFATGSSTLLYVVLFFMALQSAFFGPSKYGIIPELAGRDRLSEANSILVLFSYLAIILGLAVAPALVDALGGNYTLAAVGPVVIALAGWWCSRNIEYTLPAGQDTRASLFFIRDIWKTLGRIRKDHHLFLAVLAAAYFFMVGAFIQSNVIPYGLEVLELSETKSGYLFFVSAIGIGLGAVIAGRLSGRNVELGIVPLGAVGLTVFCIALAFVPTNVWAVGSVLFFLGLSAGLFVVPLNAFIQFKSPHHHLGEILAASGFIGWIGALIAAGLVILFKHLGWSPQTGFLAIGVLTLVLSAGSIFVLPDFILRFFVLLLTKLVYRVKVTGAEHIPVDGPALLVSNHVSFMDAFLIGSITQRRVRFLMYRRTYENKWLKPFYDLMGVIPISFDDNPKQILKSLKRARAELDKGMLVCIFAEGALTRTGTMREFKPGLERIVKNSDHPIVPIYLGGVWGSFFSYRYGPIKSKTPVRVPFPVSVLCAEPMPSTATSTQVRQAVLELSCDYFEEKKPTRKPLAHRFIQTARRNWRNPALCDTTGKKLTFGKSLIGAILFAERMKKQTAGEERIGLLLPTTVAGALANIATVLLGKASINLNYTASREALHSAIQQADLKWILTSRAFVEKLPNLALPEGVVYLEDLAADYSGAEKTRAFIKAKWQPIGFLSPSENFTADTLATILFSSGTTGTPKGVMLSHHNILSNLENFGTMIHVSSKDNICSALPFFHSFGFTATLWFPLIEGFSASYHTNPLEGKVIADLVREQQSTIIIATPTFLIGYLRRAKKEDFASLRLVVTGAEKLKDKLRLAFKEKFGHEVYEGYGATEMSPAAAVNVPDQQFDGVFQAGHKPGTIGQPIPGMAVRVLDPDTGEQLGVDAEGMLQFKGPNVMLGYLGQPDKTEAVVQDGWYTTGDIGKIDTDGFITITDRLARFSKIAGEMVPHSAIEDVYVEGLDTAERLIAVTSAPDDKKGERLVVFYKSETTDPKALHDIIAKADIPNLWKPGKNSYHEVEDIPILGSGKLDVSALRRMALELI